MQDEFDPRMMTSRRALLQGGAGIAATAALGGASLLGAATEAWAQAVPGLQVPQVKGPFQNNGATPWYSYLRLGTPNQYLKIALDTGSNFIWTTSALCAPTSCQHYGGGQFNQNASSSFRWVDQTIKPVSFGPWGTMQVETGNDVIAVPTAASKSNFYLAQNYSGSQFAQLDWDGGIGFPSGTAYADPNVSFFYNDLLNAGSCDPTMPYISFDTDPTTKTGTVLVGGYDPTRYDPNSGIWMPFKPYTQFPNVEYIWTTPLKNMYVAGMSVTPPGMQFCLDSGSSQFKGDDNAMNQALSIVASNPQAVVDLFVGQNGSQYGHLQLGPSVWNVLCEAGPQQGQYVPQFAPLGLTNLVLVGSIVMDLMYTIFVYDVGGTPGAYYLQPVGMWLFNKVGGPQVIQKPGKGGPHGNRLAVPKLGHRPVRKDLPALQRKPGIVPARGAHRGGN